MRFMRGCAVLAFVLGLAACASPARKINSIRLGMTPDEVRKQMGTKYTVRAAKVFADGQTQETWEFMTAFGLAPKDYWIFFENGKVVQWGEPGDFTGKPASSASIEAYNSARDSQ